MWRVWWKMLLKFLYSLLSVRFRGHQHSYQFFVASVRGMDLRNDGGLSEHHGKADPVDHMSLQWWFGVQALRLSGFSQLGSRCHVIQWRRSLPAVGPGAGYL